MLVHVRRLLSQTVIYGVGDAVTRVAGLILLPIYTRFLSPNDYGKFAVAILFSTLVGLILDFGQRAAFFRYYYDVENPTARRRLTGTILIFLLVAAITLSTPLLFFFDRIASSLVRDDSLVPLIQIALIGTVFDVGSTIPFAIFRAKQQAARYAMLSFSRFSISIVLNVTAVVLLNLGIVGLLYSNLITSMLFFLICLALTVRDIEWTLERDLLRQLLRFGLPLVPAGLAYWALNLSDRFFLERYTDLSQVGLYAVSYTIAGVLHMIMGWFNTAYAPYCYSIAKDSDARQIYARVLIYSVTFLTLIGLGLSLFAREILVVLTPASYHAAAGIVPFIVLAYLSYEVYYLLSFGLDLTKKTGYAPFIIGVAATINLLLNLILIPRYGILGAALATLISYLTLPVIEYPIVRSVYPIPYEWVRLLKLGLVSIGVYLAGVWLKTGQLGLDLIVGAALILGWGLVLFLLAFFPRNELLAIRALGHSFANRFSRGAPAPIDSVVTEKSDHV